MRRYRVKKIGIILPAIIALAACGDDPVPPATADGTASGKVLEGSISDAMLPLDTVQSQSPLLAPSSPDGGSSDDASTETDDREADPTPEAEETAPEE